MWTQEATARHVASTPSVVLPGGGGGYVIPGRGVPYHRMGVPQGTSRKDMGPVEVLWDGDGVPPEWTWDQWKYYVMKMEYPLPPGVIRQMPVKTVPSRITTYADGKDEANM